jgi:hypothetical protein
MKTIFKILVIVVVAVLVGGMFYGVVTAASETNQFSGQERAVNGEFNQFDHNESGGGIQLPVDSIKNFAIISFISAAYLNIVKIAGRKKPFVAARL